MGDIKNEIYLTAAKKLKDETTEVYNMAFAIDRRGYRGHDKLAKAAHEVIKITTGMLEQLDKQTVD